jgi:hypothetical protein
MGDYPIRQLVHCENDFSWMVLWELDPEFSDCLADGLCDMGGGRGGEKSLRLKASMIGEGGPCPF